MYARYVAPHSSAPHPDEPDFLPDLIKGDLDSLKPHVRDYYASRVRSLAQLLPVGTRADATSFATGRTHHSRSRSRQY